MLLTKKKRKKLIPPPFLSHLCVVLCKKGKIKKYICLEILPLAPMI